MIETAKLSEIAAELMILTGQLRAHAGAPTDPPAITAARRYARARARRPDLFGNGDPSDPAWDILIHLALAVHDRRDVSISAAASASLVAATTGLRWIERLTAAGYTSRERDGRDGRRIHLRLTDRGETAVRRALLSLADGH